MTDKIFKWATFSLFVLITLALAFSLAEKDQWLNDLDRRIESAERLESQVSELARTQKYSEPIVAIAENVSEANLELRKTVTHAREVVTLTTDELERTKIALQNSVKLLSDQIDENYRAMETIKKQEKYIEALLEKIPKADRPSPGVTYEVTVDMDK